MANDFLVIHSHQRKRHPTVGSNLINQIGFCLASESISLDGVNSICFV